jgi:hypothetical protein
MVTIFGDHGATRSSGTPVLYSSTLIAFLASEKGAKPQTEAVAESSNGESNRMRMVPKSSVVLPSKENPSRRTAPEAVPSFNKIWNDDKRWDGARYNIILPALAAVGSAGLAVYLKRRPLKTLNIRNALSTLPFLTASPTLLYTSLATNIICSATILYMYERQRTLAIQSQSSLLSIWEEQATQRAKSRTLALQEHYETHLEALRKQHQEVKTDIQDRWSAIQISQNSALGSIAAAERSAWRKARATEAAGERLERRMGRLEEERDALRRRLDDDELALRGVERRLSRIETKLKI